MRILRALGRAFKYGLIAIGALGISGGILAIANNYTATQGSGTTFASVVISSANYMAMLICDATAGETNCSTVKAASTPAAATDPAIVVAVSPNNTVGLSAGSNTVGAISNTTFAATQATAANLNATVVGTGTFATQVSSSALPTGAATAALQPTNAAQGSTTSGQTGHLTLGAATTSAPTYTTGDTEPISLDLAGNIRVNCITGCGGGTGGTAIADESAFTQGTTQFTPIGGIFNSSITNLTSGQAGALQLTNDRNAFVNLNKWAGTAITNTPTAVGTAGTGNTPTVNEFIVGCVSTVCNANGLASMANSSPVVIASDQKVSTQNLSTPINISTATTTQLVALVSGEGIHVTHWDVLAGGTGNITLEYGTGTACATGTTLLTGAYNLTAQSGLSAGDGNAAVLQVPSGNALCALTSAAVQMSGAVTYQQF